MVMSKKIKSNALEYLQFSNLNFDYMLASKLANNYFSNQENFVKNYINIGVLNSARSFIVKDSDLKFSIKKSMNIPNKKFIISFFDTSAGYAGMVNFKGYNKFLQSINFVSTIYPEFVFVLKTKSNYEL